MKKGLEVSRLGKLQGAEHSPGSQPWFRTAGAAPLGLVLGVGGAPSTARCDPEKTEPASPDPQGHRRPRYASCLWKQLQSQLFPVMCSSWCLQSHVSAVTPFLVAEGPPPQPSPGCPACPSPTCPDCA